MAGKRVARLNEQFRREITGILRTQVRDPRVGFPTVTGADVAPDLSFARIHIRPDPALVGADAAEGLMKGLGKAAPYIRRELGKTLPIRRIPELRFQLDRSAEVAARIDELLAGIEIPDAEEVNEDTTNEDGWEDDDADDGDGFAR